MKYTKETVLEPLSVTEVTRALLGIEPRKPGGTINDVIHQIFVVKVTNMNVCCFVVHNNAFGFSLNSLFSSGIHSHLHIMTCVPSRSTDPLLHNVWGEYCYFVFKLRSPSLNTELRRERQREQSRYCTFPRGPYDRSWKFSTKLFLSQNIR
jgi:hypothetical protein